MLNTEKKNKVKLYGVIIGIVTLALQHGIYLLANELAGLIGIPAFLPKINAIDNLIPIVAIFIIPYVWSYIYWAMAPMAVSKCEFIASWPASGEYLANSQASRSPVKSDDTSSETPREMSVSAIFSLLISAKSILSLSDTYPRRALCSSS